MPPWTIYLLLGLLVVMAWLAQNRTYVLQYLFFCRFPIFFGFLLAVLLPKGIGSWAASFLGNLVVLEGGAVFFVGALTVLLALAVRNTAMRTLELVPHRNTLGFLRPEPEEPVPPAHERGIKRLLHAAAHAAVAFSAWFYAWAYRLAGGPSRSYADAEQRLYEWVSLGAYSLLALPLLIQVASNSSSDGLLWLGAVVGLAMGAVALYHDPPRDPDRWQKMRRWRRRRARSRWAALRHPFWWVGERVVAFMVEPCCLETQQARRPRPKEALPIAELVRRHGHAAFLTSVAVAFFVLLYVLSVLRPGEPLVAALAPVLALLILCCFALALVAVFLDVFRVPVLLTVLFLLAGVYVVSGVDYYYPWRVDERVAALGPRPPVLTPAEALGRWRVANPADSVLTVVTASGGGIRAAQWTAEVLTRLNEATDGQFGRSALFISAVSGGSVGSMYFLDRLPSGPGEDLRLVGDSVRAAAAASSLYATVNGYVYGDFWRWLLPFIASDRGRALERAWALRLRDPELTLMRWQAPPHSPAHDLSGDPADDPVGDPEGGSTWRPYPVFNATIAETGEPFILSPVGGLGDSARSFAELYRGRDVRLATAARLSATFPVVSPMARPEPTATGAGDGVPEHLRTIAGPVAYHLADGGYFDNHGVMTARLLLERALEADTSGVVRRVLFVQARSAEPARRPAGEGEGLKFATVGPLTTLAAVRSASQVTRNAEELRLFRTAQERDTARGVEVLDSPVFLIEGVSTLSWHLSGEEKAAIRDAWGAEVNLEACRQVVQALGAAADSTAARRRCLASLR